MQEAVEELQQLYQLPGDAQRSRGDSGTRGTGWETGEESASSILSIKMLVHLPRDSYQHYKELGVYCSPLRFLQLWSCFLSELTQR